MRQNRKSPSVQERKGQGGEPYSPPARRGRVDAAGNDVLNHAAGALGKAGFADMSLVLRWREIAGPELARIAVPSRFQEGPEGATLSLRCEAGAALFLQHQTRALIDRLNAYLGPERVVRLRFVPGRISTPPDVPLHPGPEGPAGDSGEAPPKELSGALERLRLRRQTKRQVPLGARPRPLAN